MSYTRLTAGIIEARPLLMQFFSKRVSEQDAEDLTQDVLLKAWRYRDNYNKERDARAWLWTIAHNLLSNHYRDEDRNPEETVEDPVVWKFIARYDPGYDRRLEQRELINRIMSQLNERYQMLLRFHYLEGYSCEELADVEGTTEEAVKSALKRARRKARNVAET